MKQCKKCNQTKSLTEYCSRKGEKDGKHRYCKSCLNGDSKTYYHTSGRKDSDYYKSYRDENKKYFNDYSHTHYHTKKEIYRKYNRDRYSTDNEYRTKHTVSSRIHQALKTYQLLKKDKTLEYLGCPIGEYCIYLESKFDNKMGWDNQGTYWQIDHILPIASFDLNDEEELYKCFHYTNTQPMEALENRLKGDKIL